ncbi:phosphoserine phosphatase SerB [Microbacterium esteraromaticum]|uniref:phosphoserine phosphatase n=1 Tax=Microbacterium esteraromaticum TaxID=57043 RepID=A0A939IRY3_9MICO|nr:phosphoserine phosphatase SerB [Microbacterium esteraromaticum]MBN8206300.1 phosphoserine phosphatase SerB [Microbacterium esteraromaticum]MBN8416455.1 phosphoserine phosphatase SerB [Microbacterium esteraromaticum]MBN8423186.1 phosphoserine phosphatase SerB [Microbacterium esteraromaticum]MBY6061098.1 phosphoserine phosphatase SerB [Microbacterium esteraromaticum]MCA1306467.1 phosphoserine phosphatase SerB [Microbacterium esteraromaticum]
MTAARFLVVLDADSTLIRNEVIELLADEAGRRAEVQAATEAAMRGEVDFADSLRSRVAALRGVPVEAFARVRARIEPTPGVRELTDAVHQRGGVVGVVSGGFHEILDEVAPALGVDRWRANRLAVDDGVLTGAVEGEIVDAAAKAASLTAWAAELGVAPHATIAIGDGANDLHMMATAGLGLAFNAKPAVRAAAALVVGPQDLSEVIPLLP